MMVTVPYLVPVVVGVNFIEILQNAPAAAVLAVRYLLLIPADNDRRN